MIEESLKLSKADLASHKKGLLNFGPFKDSETTVYK